MCDWVGWMVHVCVRIMGMNREGRAGVCGGRGEGEGCFLLCDVVWCACVLVCVCGWCVRVWCGMYVHVHSCVLKKQGTGRKYQGIVWLQGPYLHCWTACP